MKRKQKKILIRLCFLFLFLLCNFLVWRTLSNSGNASAINSYTPVIWKIRSIDTMKTSRDNARSELNNPSYDNEIKKQLLTIKDTGANYVSINTPYDNEFLPYLTRWVGFAREVGLHVWFRGNWSSWEGWFDYPKNMTPNEHVQKTTDFILSHQNLFQSGDIFDPCPECENAGFWPQPEKNQDYLNFLVENYNTSKLAFETIKKDVAVRESIIGGRAKDVLDKETVNSLGNVIFIDHYTNSPENVTEYINYFSNSFNAKVVFSEFGAPIPDINGNMNESVQADFINNIFEKIYQKQDNVLGINYWVIKGGTTTLLNEDYSKRQAVGIVTNYFSPFLVTGKITDDFNKPLANVVISAGFSKTKTDNNGKYSFAIPNNQEYVVRVGGGNYSLQERMILQSEKEQIVNYDFVISPLKTDFWYKIRLFIKNL